MKISRRIKCTLGLLLMGIVLSVSVIMVNAGFCNHGAETPTYEAYRSEVINCIQTTPHQCYVGGQLTTCQTYVYKLRVFTHCTSCKAEGPTHISYGPTIHQYMH